uniref:Trafficking protein particle complex subunit 11 n=1 Tax=Haemonchus contortus TaxID=6289 RepID=A0A7I4XT41_HAECO
MDQKWRYDLASLLRAHKPHQVTVTCKGSDNGFIAYQNAITARFLQQPVVWKRQGKPFPHPLTFSLKFCAFDESLCFGPHMTYSDLPNIAYLHVFVIDSASVDEYRTSVRYNVSEWFAKVSTKSDVQWLIIIDSTRAKEKKNRPALIERLKHDFSKHTSRLIEVSESVEHGSFMGLVQAVQTALLAHLDILSDTWEASLITAREKYIEMNWSLSTFCSSTMEFARLYWSLGAYEHAMQMYDDLDVHLFDVINKMAEEDAGREPRWLVALRAASLPFRSLYSSFEQPKLDCKKDHSLVAIRHFLLAQQILLSLSQYNAKHRSRGAPPSLRVDFAALVLRYTHRVMNIVLEQSRTALMNVSIARLACWCLVVSSEALHIAGLLADPSTVEGAAAALCGIQTQRFYSMLDLAELPESGPSETRSSLCEWLSASDDSSGSGEYLREVLQSPNNFASQFFKAHELASATLMQCGRTRQAAYIGWKMAEWMRRNDRDAGALPLELRFVSSLLESGAKSQPVVDVMKRIVPHLKDDIDFERSLSYRLYVALHDSDEDERKKFAEEFIEQLSNGDRTKKLSLAEPPGIPKDLFRATVRGFTPIVQVPNGRVSIDFEVISKFPFSIPNFCLRLKLREVDEHVLSRRKGNVYDVHFSEREQVARVITLSKSKHRRKSLSRSKSPVASHRSGEELLLTCSSQDLDPGSNEIIVSGLVQSRGCFILDSVQATLFDDMVSIGIDDVKTKRMVTIFVQSTPNKLWIDQSRDLLAGVVQRVNVTVEAGSMLDSSKVEVRSDPNDGIEFMGADRTWSSNVSVEIPQLGPGGKHTFELTLCLFMDSAFTASPAVRKAKISCEWFGRVWSLELPFVALLIMTSRTSMLENKTLLELEIARAVGHAEQWTVVLENAVIEAIDSSVTKETPNQLGKLLNRDLGELMPNVVSSLVWVLPLAGELPISHRLSIDYRVKPTKETELESDDRMFLDRLYSYHDTFDLHVPKVGYELCAQMLSQQPGAQLCRAGTACDLVISLRSMVPCVEILYIVLDADEKLWKVTERAKVIQVKESGLGQIAFSIVPCAAGFLPYPSVSVYSCNSIGPRLGETWTEGVDILPGNLLPSFLRTGGKQIRVLGACQTEQEPVEQKKGLKHKLGKLFD